MFALESSQTSLRARWPIILLAGLLMLVCLACSAGGLFWLATPTYLGAQLTQINRLEIANGHCVSKQGQLVPTPAFFISRVFLSSDSAASISNWYMQRGWTPVNRITGRGSFLIPVEPTSYDVWVGRVQVYTGLAVTRLDDNSTRIMMRSSVVFCTA